MRQTLLITQFDTAQVQDPILHGRQNPLTPPGVFTLVQCGHDSQRKMQAGPRITDLCASDERRAVKKSRS